MALGKSKVSKRAIACHFQPARGPEIRAQASGSHSQTGHDWGPGGYDTVVSYLLIYLLYSLWSNTSLRTLNLSLQFDKCKQDLQFYAITIWGVPVLASSYWHVMLRWSALLTSRKTCVALVTTDGIEEAAALSLMSSISCCGPSAVVPWKLITISNKWGGIFKFVKCWTFTIYHSPGWDSHACMYVCMHVCGGSKFQFALNLERKWNCFIVWNSIIIYNSSFFRPRVYSILQSWAIHTRTTAVLMECLCKLIKVNHICW